MDTKRTEQTVWAKLSPEGKRTLLLLRQQQMLDTFREKNAISQTQYEEGLKYLETANTKNAMQ